MFLVENVTHLTNYSHTSQCILENNSSPNQYLKKYFRPKQRLSNYVTEQKECNKKCPTIFDTKAAVLQ